MLNFSVLWYCGNELAGEQVYVFRGSHTPVENISDYMTNINLDWNWNLKRPWKFHWRLCCFDTLCCYPMCQLPLPLRLKFFHEGTWDFSTRPSGLETPSWIAQLGWNFNPSLKYLCIQLLCIRSWSFLHSLKEQSYLDWSETSILCGWIKLGRSYLMSHRRVVAIRKLKHGIIFTLMKVVSSRISIKKNWQHLFNEQCVNGVWESWKQFFLNVLTEHTPIWHEIWRCSKPIIPWLTRVIKYKILKRISLCLYHKNVSKNKTDKYAKCQQVRSSWLCVKKKQGIMKFKL